MQKPSYNIAGLTNKQKRNMNYSGRDELTNIEGVQGNPLLQPATKKIRRKSDSYPVDNDLTYIRTGNDRPGEVGSGYGGHTGAGTIDIVAGPCSSDIKTVTQDSKTFTTEPVSIDPNLAMDASRIYISQKTDIDKNFAIARGQGGNSRAKAAIGIKSDAVRLMGREGVKIVTKTDKKNSHGAYILSNPKIELIGSNNDSDQQPAVKADALNGILSTIITRIEELNQTVDSFMTNQIEFNSAVMVHDHFDAVAVGLGRLGGAPTAINGGKTSLSTGCIDAGFKSLIMSQLSKHDGVMHQLKCATTDMAMTKIFGSDTANSTNVTLS